MSETGTDIVRQALDAVSGIPRDDEGPVFRAPWEAQAFAMTLRCISRGCSPGRNGPPH
jgi:hypothetical protein